MHVPPPTPKKCGAKPAMLRADVCFADVEPLPKHPSDTLLHHTGQRISHQPASLLDPEGPGMSDSFFALAKWNGPEGRCFLESAGPPQMSIWL